MRKILFIMLLAVFSVNCRKSEKPYKVYLRSYVMYYYDVSGIDLEADNTYARITVYNLVGENMYSYEDAEGPEKEAYDAWCEKHGDMTFNRIIQIVNAEPRTQYPAIQYTSIDITSNADFNAEHTAGSSLNDIVGFLSSSVKPYIDSGYVEYSKNNPSYPVRKLVSDLTPDDLILTGYSRIFTVTSHFGILEFKEKPTLSKSHTITVTMKADDGRTFTASVDMQFE